MEITLWYYFNINDKTYEYNHYEYLHLNKSKPTIHFKEQKSWISKEWKHEHAYLINEKVQYVRPS